MSASRLLILGGTQFIGRVFVEHLLQTNAPYKITLFNRGIHNADIFPEIEKIHGDRETGEIDKVLSRDWDHIVDINGYFPNTLERFIPKIKGKVGRYVYVSTVSVYDDERYFGRPNVLIGEDEPMWGCTAEQREGDRSQWYGEKKAECERILLANDWLDTKILRPSIVYGRYDYSDRLYYWLQRIKTRERILIPDEGQERGNMTFVEDLAGLLTEALVLKSERRAYNAVTHEANTLLEKLQVMCKVLSKTPTFVSLGRTEIEDIKQPQH